MYDMLQMLPKIVNMTIAASFAGCVVLLLRAVLRKVPAGYFYALWLMVFLRFLCPFTWESAVSLIPIRGDAVTYKSIVSAGVNVYTGVSAALPADSVIRKSRLRREIWGWIMGSCWSVFVRRYGLRECLFFLRSRSVLSFG